MPALSSWSRPMFWTFGVTLIAAEGLAFWSLCNQQIDKAQVRRAQAQAVQMAFADCLASVGGATFASCRRQALADR